MPFALDSFLMLLGRLSGLFISAPIFASKQIPIRIKILIIILLAAIMSGYAPVKYALPVNNPATTIAAIVVEIFVGYCIGFVAYVIFTAIQLAGQLMDMQMGFGVVNVLDPQSGMQVPMMGNFSYLLTLFTYLVMDGHHYLLEAVVQSYQVIPVLGANLGGDFTELMVRLTTYMFVIAVKISAPVVLAILIADISTGFIARTVPQMNVFMVGMPLKIFIGFMAITLLMTVYVWFMGVMMGKMLDYLDLLLLTIGM